ncbi:MAG: hypothetical protein KC414_15015 [Romboutsia sp.]|nr:hypothetical protein [Romboutsia sp.]
MLLESAMNLVNNFEKGLIFDSEKNLCLLTLMHIERAVDAYRVLISPASGFDFPEDKRQANQKLDLLRKKIYEIKSALDPESVAKSLEVAGREFSIY